MRRCRDAALVRRGLADSRAHARVLIESGKVLVGGAPAAKAARQVDAGEPVIVVGDGPRFVGRGGEKLAGALEQFGLDPSGARVLDAGASTGGFTDALLQNGADSVVALDVGHGQLHERLRNDVRVTVLERTNLRHVDPGDLGPFDAAVADLSFISLTKVMGVLVGCCRDGGWLVLLVKPQFEADRREASRGRGVISDPSLWEQAVQEVVHSAEEHGASVLGLAVSPLRGADGNVEFLLHLAKVGGPDPCGPVEGGLSGGAGRLSDEQLGDLVVDALHRAGIEAVDADTDAAETDDVRSATTEVVS